MAFGDDLTLLGTRIAVRFQPLIERESKTGLIISDPKVEGKPNRGKVLAVGIDVKTVSVGDFIYFDEPNPHGYNFEGEKVIFVDEENVQGKLEDD